MDMPYPNKGFMENYKVNDGSVGGPAQMMGIPKDMGFQNKTTSSKPAPKKNGKDVYLG